MSRSHSKKGHTIVCRWCRGIKTACDRIHTSVSRVRALYSTHSPASRCWCRWLCHAFYAFSSKCFRTEGFMSFLAGIPIPESSGGSHLPCIGQQLKLFQVITFIPWWLLSWWKWPLPGWQSFIHRAQGVTESFDDLNDVNHLPWPLQRPDFSLTSVLDGTLNHHYVHIVQTQRAKKVILSLYLFQCLHSVWLHIPTCG